MITTEDVRAGRKKPTLELSARSEQGRRFVALCEEHAADFARRADQHDRDGSFPFENWEAMKASGVLTACTPAELGGLGVTLIHDVAVGISRLARGDASTAIGANMHLAQSWVATRRWREAQAGGDDEALARAETKLRVLAGTVFAGPSTEPGNDSSIRPATTATPVDGGYVINGRKAFGTNSPVADLFGFFVTVPADGQDPDRLATAAVLRGTPGMTLLDDWDALGMRASGSNSAVFESCFVPAAMVEVGSPVGRWDASVHAFLFSVTFPLVGAFLGIAEAARDYARGVVTTKRKNPGARLMSDERGVQQLAAEIEIDLAAARAVLAGTAALIDDYYEARHPSEAQPGDLDLLMMDFQCTNATVKHNAVAVVDRAMSMVGGASYATGNPLARLWRDVRAGSFMQPYSPVHLYEFVGKVALGLDPTLEAARWAGL